MTPTQTKPAATPHSPLPLWQITQHDNETFLVFNGNFKGTDAGVLFPHADFPIATIHGMISDLNSAPALRESLAKTADALACAMKYIEYLQPNPETRPVAWATLWKDARDKARSLTT